MCFCLMCFLPRCRCGRGRRRSFLFLFFFFLPSERRAESQKKKCSILPGRSSSVSFVTLLLKVSAAGGYLFPSHSSDSCWELFSFFLPCCLQTVISRVTFITVSLPKLFVDKLRRCLTWRQHVITSWKCCEALLYTRSFIIFCFQWEL